MLVDFGKGVRTRGPDPNQPDYVQGDERYAVTNITPQVFVERRTEPGWHFRTAEGNYVHDREGRSGHLYTHPYPVSDREFLVSYKVEPTDHYKDVPNAYALYLIDTDGNHRPVHADQQLSCWHPLPLILAACPAAAGINSGSPVRGHRSSPVHRDQYSSRHGGDRAGRSQVVADQRSVAALLVHRPAMVAVEQQFQLEGRLVAARAVGGGARGRRRLGSLPGAGQPQSLLAGPGREFPRAAARENLCQLCARRSPVLHGLPRSVQPSGASRQFADAAGLDAGPECPQPQPCDLVENGGDGLAGQVIHYPTDIQPILDAKCVSCHGASDPAGGLRLTGETTAFYNTSYEELGKRELAGPIISEFTSFLHGDRGNYNGAYLPPRTLGSPASKLIEILTDAKHPMNAKDNHAQMLTEMERMIVSRWVDSNYQFYGSYFGRQHPQWVGPDPNQPAYDPADFRRKATFEEAINFLAPPWHR
jgi:hypothetical protein